MYIAPAPQWRSPKLETTRSLKKKSLLLNTYYLGTATQTKNKQTKQTKTKQKANKKMADTFLFKGRQELLHNRTDILDIEKRLKLHSRSVVETKRLFIWDETHVTSQVSFF